MSDQRSADPRVAAEIERLRDYRYPQAHAVRAPSGAHLVVVPSVRLHGYTHDICTVLFLLPPGYPAAQPDHFWIDIPDLELDPLGDELKEDSDGKWRARYWKPKCTNRHNRIPEFPQWSATLWFSWHLQMWNPNTDNLITYFNVIGHRLKPAR